MKYREKPEKQPVKSSREVSTLVESILNAKKVVTIILKIVRNMKLIIFISFFVNSIFWLLTKVSFLTKRVLFARIVKSGTTDTVLQIAIDDNVGISKVYSAYVEKVNPDTIPTKKNRFHNLFFVNQPVSEKTTGSVDSSLVAVKGEEVANCSLGVFNTGLDEVNKGIERSSFLLRSFLISSKLFILALINYWFKTLVYILSNLAQLSKGIIQKLVVFSLCFQESCIAATPVNNCDVGCVKSIILESEKKNKIPKGLLAAIAKVESGNRSYAINTGGKSIYSSSLQEAVSIAESKINSGTTNIDLGVMQLNYRWHGKEFSNLKSMLTPKKNIEYAAILLASLYQKHGNWQKAVRYYHSSKAKHNRVYSRKVAMVWLEIN